MRKTKTWTEEESTYLKEHYLDSISSLVKNLGRSWSSIHHKTWRLGFIRQGRVPHPCQGKKSPRRHIFNYNIMFPSLAYLLGVYLGDGNVCKVKTGAFFQQSSIDEDFILKTQKTAQNILGFLPNYHFYSKRGLYLLRICSTEFANWLIQITDKKQKIPDDVLNAKRNVLKEFINGLLDSEGSISASPDKRYKEKKYGMYFAITSSWIELFQELLKKIGVKTSKIRTTSGIPRFTINILSFYQAGLKFSIRRKQCLVENYISVYHPDAAKGAAR